MKLTRLDSKFESNKCKLIGDISWLNITNSNKQEIDSFLYNYKNTQGSKAYDELLARRKALCTYDEFTTYLMKGELGLKINIFTDHLVKLCIKDLDDRQDTIEYYTHQDVLELLAGNYASHTFNANWGNNLYNFYTKSCIIIQCMIDSIHYIDEKPYASIPAKLIKSVLGSAQRGYSFDKNLLLNALRRVGYISENTLVNNLGVHYELTDKFNSKLSHKSFMLHGPIVNRWIHKVLTNITEDELYNIYGLMNFEPKNHDYYDAIKYLELLRDNKMIPEDLGNKFSNSYYQAFLTIAFKEKDFITLFNHKISKKCGRRFTTLTSYKSELRKKMYDLNGKPTIEVDLCASQASQLHNMFMHARINRESKLAQYIRKVMLNYYIKNGVDDTLMYLQDVHNKVNTLRLQTNPLDKDLNEVDVDNNYRALKELHERSRMMGSAKSGRSSIYTKGSKFNKNKYYFDYNHPDNETSLDNHDFIKLCQYFLNRGLDIDINEWKYMNHRYKKYKREFMSSTRNKIELSYIGENNRTYDLSNVDSKLRELLDMLIKVYDYNKNDLAVDLDEQALKDELQSIDLKISESSVRNQNVDAIIEKLQPIYNARLADYNNAVNTDYDPYAKQRAFDMFDVVDRQMKIYKDYKQLLARKSEIGKLLHDILDNDEKRKYENEKAELLEKSKNYINKSDEVLNMLKQTIESQLKLYPVGTAAYEIAKSCENDVNTAIYAKKRIPELDELIKTALNKPKDDAKYVIRQQHIINQLQNYLHIDNSCELDTEINSRISKFWKLDVSQLTKVITYSENWAAESENDFYYQLWCKLQDSNKILINNGKWGRDHIKKMFCRVVYGNKYLYDNNKSKEFNDITTALKSFDNGNLLRLINTYKYNRWNLAIDVMKVESFFMNFVWTRLKNKSIVYSSIHDSIKSTLDNAIEIDHIINDIANILGFSYHTKFEY